MYYNNPRNISGLQENNRRETAAIIVCSHVFVNMGVRLQEYIERNGRHLIVIIFKN